MSKSLELNIEGMTCGSCSRAITARVSKFDFTSDVEVDWEKGTAKMQVGEDYNTNIETIKKAITQLNYKVIN